MSADYLKAFSIEFSFLNCGNVHLVFIYAFRSRRNLFIKFMESLTFQQNLVENNFLIHCSADLKLKFIIIAYTSIDLHSTVECQLYRVHSHHFA